VPATARTDNHDLRSLNQFVRFGAGRLGHVDRCRLGNFWRDGPAQHRNANRCNGGTSEHVGKHSAAIHIHVFAPGPKAQPDCKPSQRNIESGLYLLRSSHRGRSLNAMTFIELESKAGRSLCWLSPVSPITVEIAALRSGDKLAGQSDMRMLGSREICHRVIAVAPIRNHLTGDV
jgi:hypothetical protein